MASGPSSLTGSDCGAPQTHSSSVSLALGHLQGWVAWCCWLIAGALLIQCTIWMMTAFTGVRWQEIRHTGSAPLIVTAEGKPVPQIRSALDEPIEEIRPAAPLDPNRMLTRWDRVFATLSALAGGIGAISVLILVPLVTMGALLATASATAGVERTISAFGWSLIVGLLLLSFGGVVGLPWQDGSLWSYSHLTSQIETHMNEVGPVTPLSDMGLTVVSRYLILPLACVLGVGMVGMQFSVGVKAGLMRKENLMIDTGLEQEAANVRPTSLHASRTASVISSVVPPAPTPPPPARPISAPRADRDPEMPKRLI